MLKQQWQHSQQLLASGQKALLSHVHVPHAPHLPSGLSTSTFSSWWQGTARGARKAAGGSGAEGSIEQGEVGGDGMMEGHEAAGDMEGHQRHRYAPREEPRDLRAHKSLRRWVAALVIFYLLVMLMSLPGSRRRFQERLRRGGGSMRALALERSKHEWDLYLRRTMSQSTSLAALGRR